MTERDKYFWPKLLAGFAFALLVTDVLALSWLDTRLATSRQADTSSLGQLARPTYTGIEQALILPTHDPNKQWPTRTPTPSPTPWLIPTAPVVPTTTDEPIPDQDAGLVSPEISIDDAESTRLLDPNPTASSLPEVTSDVVTPTRVIVTTSTATPIGITATPSPTPTSSPETTEGEIVPTDTPADVEPVATASTPEVVVPTATPPPFTAGDESQFLSYVQSHYNSLAGQVLNLASVSIVQTPDGLPAAQIEISGEGENNVFAGQTPVAQQDFGRRLLDDTKYFFADQACAIQVIVDFDTLNLDQCANNAGSCYVNGFVSVDQGWSVAWTYVTGIFDGESEAVETWGPAE